MRELLRENSHFYGVNPENNEKNCEDLARDLYMMSRSFVEWTHFVQLLKSEEVKVYNCTQGGIFDMFERRNYENIFSLKE